MPNLLENNAYRVLGLNVTASPKDILRRYKEIINRLKIGDCPKYDLDIGLSENFRNESIVKDALKELQSPKSSIKEYFFWFQLFNANDERAQNYLIKGEFSKAIQIWKALSENKNTISFFYKKNLAVIYCLLLMKEDNQEYFKDSISIWNELINSEEFWSAFSKTYSAQNELITSQENISSFRNSVIKDISDIYADLGQIHKNPRYIKGFQEVFGSYGEKTEKTLLQPLYQKINDKINELKKINIVSEDKQYSNVIDERREQDTINEIDNVIKALQENFQELRKNGLYENAKSRIVRDHTAEAIREKSVELFNYWFPRMEEDWLDKFGPCEEAAWLLDLASKIAGNESYKSSLENDKVKLANAIMADNKSVVTANIFGFLSNKSAEFKPRFVEYEGKKIFYKNITHITYNAIRSNYSTTYYFTIGDGNEYFSLTFSDLGTYQKVVGIAYQAIIPGIVKKYTDEIFDEGKVVTIGDVNFSKKGYTRQSFWGGAESVSWDEIIYTPQLYAGYVILYKDNGGRSKVFARIPMTTENAIVLPFMIRECVNTAVVLGMITVRNVNTQQTTRTGDNVQDRNQRQNMESNGAVKKVGDSWISYTGSKYYVINNKSTGHWDICSNNQSNPPLEKYIWAGDFNSKEEAEAYLKETLQNLKMGSTEGGGIFKYI